MSNPLELMKRAHELVKALTGPDMEAAQAAAFVIAGALSPMASESKLALAIRAALRELK